MKTITIKTVREYDAAGKFIKETIVEKTSLEYDADGKMIGAVKEETPCL